MTNESAVKTEDGYTPKKEEAFVNYIINRCKDNGVRASLSRAENPATEYQSWEVLAAFQINLTFDNQRIPYAFIAATMAKNKIDKNGHMKLGTAIASCYSDGSLSDQAKAKLRRLLACDTTDEACRILRPLMALIYSRGINQIDYVGLLKDLLWFSFDESRARSKARWAQDFYGKSAVSAGAKDD